MLGRVGFLVLALAAGFMASCTAPYQGTLIQAGAGLFAVAGSNFTTGSTNVTVKICGKIPGAQDVPATGAYTDAVVVNVNF